MVLMIKYIDVLTAYKLGYGRHVNILVGHVNILVVEKNCLIHF